MKVDIIDIKIKYAKKEDLRYVYKLVKELAEFEKEPQAVTSEISDYERAFDDRLINILIATHSEKIIGMALYYVTFSTWKGQNMYLEDFYVTTGYRSLGVGQMLFDAFIKEAKTKKCKMVKWQVLDWNKEAIKFYNRNNAIIEDHWKDCKIFF